MKSVLTIGEILVEIMATERGDGFLEPIALRGPFPSGAPAIFIDQAARFGQPAAMIGCVGDDDFGRVNLERLRRDGVDVSGIRIDPEAATGSAFVRYRPDGSRAFVFNIKHSASGRIALDAAARAVLDRSDHLHVMGTALFSPPIVDIVMEAVETIKSARRHGFVRPESAARDADPPGPAGGLRGPVSPLRPVPAERPGTLPVHGRASRNRPPSPKSSAMGCGRSFTSAAPRAQPISRPARKLTQPGFAVEEVDPTGAGDCFGATFVSCWLRAMPPERCLAYAAASGALAVTRQGPMEGAASQAELDAFLASRP